MYKESKGDCGKSYTNSNTINIVCPKQIISRCKGTFCAKSGRKCMSITDEEREWILSNHEMGNRGFVAHHIETKKHWSKQLLLFFN